jgi:hypothetical protein
MVNPARHDKLAIVYRFTTVLHAVLGCTKELSRIT